MKKIGIMLLLSCIYGTPMILGMEDAATKEEQPVAASREEAQLTPPASAEQPAEAEADSAAPQAAEAVPWYQIWASASQDPKDKLLLDLTEQLKAAKAEIVDKDAIIEQLRSDIKTLQAAAGL